jgi:hypothetical protein
LIHRAAPIARFSVACEVLPGGAPSSIPIAGKKTIGCNSIKKTLMAESPVVSIRMVMPVRQSLPALGDRTSDKTESMRTIVKPFHPSDPGEVV